MMKVGDVVVFAHPDWGRVRGKILVIMRTRVLVQDLSPHGAREWWPIGEVRKDDGQLTLDDSTATETTAGVRRAGGPAVRFT